MWGGELSSPESIPRCSALAAWVSGGEPGCSSPKRARPVINARNNTKNCIHPPKTAGFDYGWSIWREAFSDSKDEGRTRGNRHLARGEATADLRQKDKGRRRQMRRRLQA